MLQLQGATPMTPIEVKAKQLMISEMLLLQGARPLTPFVVKSEMFPIAYLTTCYLKNASA